MNKFIAKIVKDVTNKINCDPLHVVDYPVGLQYLLLQVNRAEAYVSDRPLASEVVGFYIRSI
jgi:ABC-type amino acid transport substrate-binding protein